MKTLLINGSPHANGCTHYALSLIEEELNRDNVETEIVWVGSKPIRGCQGCWKCDKRCVFDDDPVNMLIEKAEGADAFVFGSPVYFAAASGQMTCLMNRLFAAGGHAFEWKPGCAVVAARRAGTTAALDQLHKYIAVGGMMSVPSPYWNMIHGNTPEEAARDEEGVYIMRSLGANLAWMLKSLALGRATAGMKPRALPPRSTNFIR